MRTATFVAAAICLGLLAGCEPTSTESLEPATIPPSTEIKEPAATVPAEYAAFSGLWSGKWGGVLDSKLAVHTVQPDGRVAAIYAWGDHPDGRFQAGSVATIGQIDGGVLKLEPFGDDVEAIFRLTEDGTLDATFDLRGEISRAEFTKS